MRTRTQDSIFHRPHGSREFLFIIIILFGAWSGSIIGAAGQTLTVVHDFAGPPADGAKPNPSLLLKGNTLFGTTDYGGNNDGGIIYVVNLDGGGFRSMHSFAPDWDFGPVCGLVAVGQTLYGTTSDRETFYWGGGAVFKINAGGGLYAEVWSFETPSGQDDHPNFEGSSPQGGLVALGQTLFGTTALAGEYGAGTVFAVATDTDGPDGLSGFKLLHGFGSVEADGREPGADLLAINDTLYGTTRFGGDSGSQGTIFAVNTNGTGYVILHAFGNLLTNSDANLDGARPESGLVAIGDTLYGTTSAGGAAGFGTVYRMKADGTGFTVLHDFGAEDGGYAGWNVGALTASGDTLYGATPGGGSADGMVFALRTNGTDFKVLYSFSGTNDGKAPNGGLVLSGGYLYGTAAEGGSSGSGTVFRLSMPLGPPQLEIASFGANVILAWPTNYTGYFLESTTNLGSSAAWSPLSTTPIILNGQNTVTHPLSQTQEFFRLSQ